MARRPTALWTAAVLLVVIGVSGLLVGLELLAVGMRPEFAADAPSAAIPVGIAAYGAAALVAGIGLAMRRRWAHRLGVVTIIAGVAVLGWETTVIGLDPITLFGIAVWGLVLALLFLPSVRAAVARR